MELILPMELTEQVEVAVVEFQDVAVEAVTEQL
jgi:hypothetical protein